MTHEDLIFPNGELQAAMFPGEDLDALAQGWFTQGEAKAAALTGEDRDRAITAYAYWRAFRTVANRFNTEAANVTIHGQVTRRRLAEQAKYWKHRADEEEHRFERLVGGAAHTITGEAPEATFTTETLKPYTRGLC